MTINNLFQLLCSLLLFTSCSNFGQVKLKGNLPKVLKEVSAVQTVKNSDLLWMLSDSGNKNSIYGVSKKGKLKKELVINAKNNDWEDLATDKSGNLYIGDFGNNFNTRKNLAVLKIKKGDLNLDKNIDVERISYNYPEQLKFPPKKKRRYFDTEAFFFFNDSLYLFTRSRVKDNYGKTTLYKIPATEGDHKAVKVSEFEFCKAHSCSITSADINSDGKKIVLLCSDTVYVFIDFKSDDFFKGQLNTYPLKFKSQKEGVCFKDSNTLYITDEKAHGNGGNLYTLNID